MEVKAGNLSSSREMKSLNTTLFTEERPKELSPLQYASAMLKNGSFSSSDLKRTGDGFIARTEKEILAIGEYATMEALSNLGEKKVEIHLNNRPVATVEKDSVNIKDLTKLPQVFRYLVETGNQSLVKNILVETDHPSRGNVVRQLLPTNRRKLTEDQVSKLALYERNGLHIDEHGIALYDNIEANLETLSKALADTDIKSPITVLTPHYSIHFEPGSKPQVQLSMSWNDIEFMNKTRRKDLIDDLDDFTYSLLEKLNFYQSVLDGKKKPSRLLKDAIGSLKSLDRRIGEIERKYVGKERMAKDELYEDVWMEATGIKLGENYVSPMSVLFDPDSVKNLQQKSKSFDFTEYSRRVKRSFEKHPGWGGGLGALNPINFDSKSQMALRKWNEAVGINYEKSEDEKEDKKSEDGQKRGFRDKVSDAFWNGVTMSLFPFYLAAKPFYDIAKTGVDIARYVFDEKPDIELDEWRSNLLDETGLFVEKTGNGISISTINPWINLAKEAPDFSTGLNYISEDGIPSREPERAYTFLRAQPDGTVKLYTDSAEALRQLGKLENSKYVSRGFKKTIKEIAGLIMRGEEVPLNEKFNRNPTITLEKSGKNYYATANDAEIQKYTWIVANKLMGSFRERQGDFKKFRKERDRIELEEGSFFTNATYGLIKEGYRQEKAALKQRERVLKTMVKDAAHIGANTTDLVAEYSHVKEGREGLEKEEKVWEGANSNFESAKDYDSKLLRLYSALSRNQALAIGGILTAVIAVPVVSYLVKLPTPDGQTTGKNRPPKADFWYRLPWRTCNYINPTSADTIMFLNNSTDLDNDTLTYWWFLNNTIASTDKNFNRTLPVLNYAKTDYVVKLIASDGKTNSTVQKIASVDPDRLPQYPEKELKVKVKGVAYAIGEHWYHDVQKGWRPQRIDEYEEDLAVIRHDLKCDGIYIYGDFDERILKAAEIAVNKGFNPIILAPRYQNAGINETIQKFSDFAKKAVPLTKISSNIVLAVGTELSTDTTAWINLPDYHARLQYRTEKNLIFSDENLHKLVADLIKCVPPDFKNVTYHRAAWENIDWNKLRVDIICSSTPRLTNVPRWFEPLKKFGRPVYSTAFGAATFEGDLGDMFSYVYALYNPEKVKYSQESQAKYNELFMKAFHEVGIDGYFYWDLKCYDINKKANVSMLEWNLDPANPKWSRKETFYMYKNYVHKN